MITLPQELFCFFDEPAMRRLQGGRIYGRQYFVMLVDNKNIVETYYGKLQNNMQSQRSPVSYPAGYLPFRIDEETTWNFDLQRKTFEVKRIHVEKPFAGRSLIYRMTQLHDALIAKTPASGSEALLLAQELQEQTWRRELVRRVVGTDFNRLTRAADFLQENFLKARAVSTLTPLARFELYLRESSEQTITDLLEVIQPDPPHQHGRTA